MQLSIALCYLQVSQSSEQPKSPCFHSLFDDMLAWFFMRLLKCEATLGMQVQWYFPSQLITWPRNHTECVCTVYTNYPEPWYASEIHRVPTGFFNRVIRTFHLTDFSTLTNFFTMALSLGGFFYSYEFIYYGLFIWRIFLLLQIF